MSIERITAGIYSSDGATLVAPITRMNGAEFRDEVSQRGNGKFRIPLDDAADIDFDSIVKFTWRGAVRFGCVIDPESCELAKDGRRWIEYQNQPGLLSLLDQATIAPEYGLGRRSGDTRRFGYMSKDGAWRVTADWVAPVAVAFADEVSPRWHHPPELKASNPSWISATPGPDTTVPTGTKNWFRKTYTLTDDTNTRIVYTGDNYTNAYFDGESIGTADQLEQWAWRTANSVDQVQVAGPHVVAFDVENAPPIAGHTFNPIGLIATCFTLDSKGEPNGILWKTEASGWEVCKVKPGWHKGYLIGEMLEEAQDRGIPGALALTATFTDTLDSNGDPWDDVVDEYAFDIETTTLTDMITALCESGINVHVNAATMELDAYNRMGIDKYATVEYKLAKDGGSLSSDVVDAVSVRATSVTVHIEDDTWLKVDDAAGIAAVGRREVGYSMGTAPNRDTAGAFASAQLAESAAPQLQVTAKPSTLRGPQFYNHCGLGDSVKLPGRRGTGNVKGRALAVTVTMNGDRAEVSPEFMVDSS